MRKWMVLLCFVLFFALTVKAEPVGSDGVENEAMLFDDDLETAQRLSDNATVRLDNPDGIAGLYLIFDRPYGTVTLMLPEGDEYFADTDGILHCYLDLEACFGKIPEAVDICFSDGSAELCEVMAFSPGSLPDWVQRWERIPDGQTDLMLFSTHGDDEQLFFAGLLPWYGAERGYRVQVVYFTDHRNMTSSRVHEMLNGLWAVGIHDYPVFGSFADYYTFDLADAYRFYEAEGQSEEVLLAFVVEQLRRGQPLVAVGHDAEGEYGHGMHQLYTDLLKKAVEVSADLAVFPELAERYGVWDVPKTYLHLYPENPVTMNWDIPMDTFDGKTAFEVTRDLGFPCHVSQQKDFAWYFRGANRASEVQKYGPCQFGLYRSTVGKDHKGGDFFENLHEDKKILPKPPEEKKTISAADQNWLLLPAVGTAALTILITAINAPAQKEKW